MSESAVIALASKHGKQDQLQPAFSSRLGWTIQVADVDTDTFGTFTGEIKRHLSPTETALEKARAGASALGLPRGLSSEGTIGPHPSIPFLTTLNELVAFVDVDSGVHVVESVVSADIHSFSQRWSNVSSLEEVAVRADFPTHAVIVRTEGESPVAIRKGITSLEKLREAVNECLFLAQGSELMIETDYRAMVCPSRQAVIEKCAWKLANRLATLCPQCDTFGWGIVDREWGLPCRDCGQISLDAVRADVEGCIGCEYRVHKPRTVQSIDPAFCEFCNP